MVDIIINSTGHGLQLGGNHNRAAALTPVRSLTGAIIKNGKLRENNLGTVLILFYDIR